MARIKVVADALAELLRTMDDSLTVYVEPPGSIDTPAITVLLGPGEPDSTMARDTDDWVFVLDVYTSCGPQGMENLYAYLDGAGDKSIIDAITADPTLGGTVEYAYVTGWGTPDRVTIGDSGTENFHVEITVQVGVAGAVT